MSTLEDVAEQTANESALWARSLRPLGKRELEPVFSPLAPPEYALGVETIYEAYLVHYGRPRLFDAADPVDAILLGDYLYAHGLVRIAGSDGVASVADLAELISLCAQVQAEGRDGEGPLWAATAALLGTGALDEARGALRLRGDASALDALARSAAGDDAVERALATHRARLR
jgi:hypothetical protein